MTKISAKRRINGTSALKSNPNVGAERHNLWTDETSDLEGRLRGTQSIARKLSRDVNNYRVALTIAEEYLSNGRVGIKQDDRKAVDDSRFANKIGYVDFLKRITENNREFRYAQEAYDVVEAQAGRYKKNAANWRGKYNADMEAARKSLNAVNKERINLQKELVQMKKDHSKAEFVVKRLTELSTAPYFEIKAASMNTDFYKNLIVSTMFEGERTLATSIVEDYAPALGIVRTVGDGLMRLTQKMTDIAKSQPTSYKRLRR